MYALQWENQIIGKVENHGIYMTEKDAFNAVIDWWELNDFKPYYIRKSQAERELEERENKEKGESK